MKLLLLFVIFLGSSAFVYSGELKPDENIQFYPKPAHFTEQGKIEVDVGAWVYENEWRPGAKSALALLMKLDVRHLSAQESSSFEARTQLFRFDSERNKRIRISFSNKTMFELSTTDEHGFAQKKFLLNQSNVIDAENAHGVQWIPFDAVLPGKDIRKFSGQIMLMPNTGLSVISDIDDTIKESNVLNRHELMLNTFVRPFKSVQGMASIYRILAQQDANTSFHYVSGSPHQLYPILQDFLRENNFPSGSLHLRWVKISDELFGKENTTQRHKLTEISALVEQFPQRRFLLIGDSGESDPETYAQVANAYPKQVIGIYIRDVTGQTVGNARYQKAFANVPATLWHIFVSADELAPIIANSNPWIPQ